MGLDLINLLWNCSFFPSIFTSVSFSCSLLASLAFSAFSTLSVTLSSHSLSQGGKLHAFIHTSVCSVDTLQKVPAAFVFLLQQSDMLIWRGNAGITDTEARCGHVKCKLNILCLSVFVCRQKWYLSARSSSLSSIVRPLLHILDVIASFVGWLVWSFAASVSTAKIKLVGLDPLSLPQITVRVARFCVAVCFQFSSVFNNPDHINNYNWSWVHFNALLLIKT